MKRLLFFILIYLLSNTDIFGQSLPIGIDGRFDDWNNSAHYTDTQDDGGDIDLLSFSVTNDSSYLFVRFVISEEIELDDNNNLYIEIDADNNALTGYPVNGIGADLAIKFEDRKFEYTPPEGSTIYLDHYDIGFYALPTVSSDTFEIAINRKAKPNGVDLLFTELDIKICFKDNISGGDYMPNEGTTFQYTFDEEPVEVYNNIDFEKKNATDVRLMTYNTLYDFTNDIGSLYVPERLPSFERIIKKVNPDIITFNECWDTDANYVKSLLNIWLPVSDGTWECKKITGWNVDGNITCSKFDITDYYSVLTDSRILATVIDLPDSYPRDIVVINSHFKAKGGTSEEATRQREADAIIDFIREIKTEGGGISMPYGTPFIISGDLNLVNGNQPLKTLLTGDIINNNEFGEDIKPDWDDSDLYDAIAFHTDERIAVTWGFDNETSYWPSRLDYAISSDEGSKVSKTFIINTGNMSEERLLENNLLSYDNETASDHLPKITDYIIEDAIENVNTISDINNLTIYPNPSPSGFFKIKSKTDKQLQTIKVYNILGQNLKLVNNINKKEYMLDLSFVDSGIYFIKISENSSEITYKIVK